MKANRIKALLYCTKSTPYLVKDDFPYENGPIYFTHYKEPGSCGSPLNGKIVASCDIETEKIKYRRYHQLDVCDKHNNNLIATIEKDPYYSLADSTWSSPEFYDLTNKCGLDFDELDAYLKQKDGYALHISNLFIFENPAELSDYNVDNSADYGSFGWAFEDNERIAPLKKAPQNMMKVFDNHGNLYVLISVHPEQAYKILNHWVTIDVRKKVLKEMSKNPYIVRATKTKINLNRADVETLKAWCSGGKK